MYGTDPEQIIKALLGNSQSDTVIQQLVTLTSELTERLINLEKKHNELEDHYDELNVELERVKAMLKGASVEKKAEEPKKVLAPDKATKLRTDICDLLWKIGARSLKSNVPFDWDEFITGAVRLAILDSSGVDIEKLYEAAKKNA